MINVIHFLTVVNYYD